MTLRFRIEDELHAEPMDGEFESFETALAEVKRLAAFPWGQPPNLAPCQSWKTCGRHYEIVEYDASTQPYWTERSRTSVLEVRSGGLKWDLEGGK